MKSKKLGLMFRICLILLISLALIPMVSGAWRKGDENCEIIGNERTGIYHKSRCGWAKIIFDINRIYFGSVASAEMHGYRPCKLCFSEKYKNTNAESNYGLSSSLLPKFKSGDDAYYVSIISYPIDRFTTETQIMNGIEKVFNDSSDNDTMFIINKIKILNIVDGYYNIEIIDEIFVLRDESDLDCVYGEYRKIGDIFTVSFGWIDKYGEFVRSLTTTMDNATVTDTSDTPTPPLEVPEFNSYWLKPLIIMMILVSLLITVYLCKHNRKPYILLWT